jgi:murein DD-endopeptidase MepM/ murein hydrolase activator NlpD
MVVGTPIAAAMPGQVVFVGGSPCCSYGYHVIIEHADGYETLYAHLSNVWVGTGQWVSGGEIIGLSGNTGYSTGPHLHFEIRRNGVKRDPLAFLP